MIDGGFARVVAVQPHALVCQRGIFSIRFETSDARDVDDAPRREGGAVTNEEWCKGSGEVEYGFDVEVKDAIPAFFLGEVMPWSTPCCPTVVHEDMDFRLL